MQKFFRTHRQFSGNTKFFFLAYLPPPQASLGLLQRERERKVDEKPKPMEKRRENITFMKSVAKLYKL
jgi:hypothetical protein